MGAGIAQMAAEKGLEVDLIDQTEDLTTRGLSTIKRFVSRKLKKGRITQEEYEGIVGRIHTGTDLQSSAQNADWVIEAIFEDKEIKKAMFKQLDRFCRSEVILASNTSTLSITALSSATQRPEKVVGMHFFSPVPVMRLVEVVKGENTSSETVDAAVELGKHLGKTPVICKDIPGFIVNRFMLLLYNEGANQLESGIAMKEDIDLALKLGANHPMGILELMDAVGVDVCYQALKAVYEATKEERYKPSPLFERMIKDGRLGRKIGKGFYDYEED